MFDFRALGFSFGEVAKKAEMTAQSLEALAERTRQEAEAKRSLVQKLHLEAECYRYQAALAKARTRTAGREGGCHG